eukprot:TRINITY_DN8659_c0_g4_i1.p1 TRINITY_DN8659_c0_g4~~TRINITY_DN8659_c0_g4_i1.p1  ORF type:complete len:274 (+),score=13.48 TRINITY_DN8659_c0_g4_i1:129-950(+)
MSSPACGRCGGCFPQAKLKRCARTSWPSPPRVPEYRSGLSDEEWKALWRAEQEERSKAPKVPVCTSTRELCSKCAKGCASCADWECSTCAVDTHTAALFQTFHEDNPLEVSVTGEPVYEDDYGRREQCRFSALRLQTCYGCAREFCFRCYEACANTIPQSPPEMVGFRGKATEETDEEKGSGNSCRPCGNVLCRTCAEDRTLRMKTTGCESCQYAADCNDDWTIGPVDRSRVCRPCFYTYPQVCDCGEPSWDPSGSECSSDSMSLGLDDDLMI